MPLVFENQIHFDPATDDAIIWADENNKRFRLVIPRELLMEKYGLLKRLDQTSAEAIIHKNLPTFEAKAQAAHEAGQHEIILG
jgi:hypothetical protein